VLHNCHKHCLTQSQDAPSSILTLNFVYNCNRKAQITCVSITVTSINHNKYTKQCLRLHVNALCKAPSPSFISYLNSAQKIFMRWSLTLNHSVYIITPPNGQKFYQFITCVCEDPQMSFLLLFFYHHLLRQERSNRVVICPTVCQQLYSSFSICGAFFTKLRMNVKSPETTITKYQYGYHMTMAVLFWIQGTAIPWSDTLYEGVSKSFQTGRLEWELQMVQLSATIAILWVSLVSFAAITLCVASQRVFVVYFVMTLFGNFWIYPSTRQHGGTTFIRHNNIWDNCMDKGPAVKLTGATASLWKQVEPLIDWLIDWLSLRLFNEGIWAHFIV